VAKISISKTTVDAAAPGPKDYFLWDTRLAGFGLKITPTGLKVYIFQYRTKRPGGATATTRITIGRHGALTAEQARDKARELALAVATGGDPRQDQMDKQAAEAAAIAAAASAAEEETRNTLQAVAKRWLADYATAPIKSTGKPRRASGVELARIVVRAHLNPKLGARAIASITPEDVEGLLDAIPAERQATRRTVAAYSSVFFKWCEKKRLIAESPMRRVERPAAVASRDRVLTGAELRSIWQASYEIGQPWGALYRLLALTGQRRSEVAGLRWEELDRDAALWTLPADRSKNGMAHQVHLSPATIEELDRLAKIEPGARRVIWPAKGFAVTTGGATAVSGFAKALRALNAAIAKNRNGEPLADWRPHDLRRTFATGLQKLGTRFEVIEACLNHRSGARSGIAGVYQRYDWAAEKRQAFDAWAIYLAGIVAPGEVLPLPRRSRDKARP
jgi:integrase